MDIGWISGGYLVILGRCWVISGQIWVLLGGSGPLPCLEIVGGYARGEPQDLHLVTFPPRHLLIALVALLAFLLVPELVVVLELRPLNTHASPDFSI